MMPALEKPLIMAKVKKEVGSNVELKLHYNAFNKAKRPVESYTGTSDCNPPYNNSRRA